MSESSKNMSVLDHIAELRRTLIWAFVMALAAAVAAWFVSDTIVDTLLRPAKMAGQQSLYFHAPMEAFLLKLKASAVVGFLLVFPLILYKIYAFVLPGLLPRERRVVTPMLVAATALFYVGVGFCFFILMPLVIRFAVGFATESLQPLLTAGYYFDFAARLCLAFGLLFELPMVVFALSWVGVVHPRTLLKGWRYALLAIVVVAAVLTPPDPLSQLMLAGPVMLLYLASVLVAMLVRRGKDAPNEEDPDDDGPDDDGPSGGPGGGSDEDGGAGEEKKKVEEGPADDPEEGPASAPEGEEDPPRPRPAEGSVGRRQRPSAGSESEDGGGGPD